MILQGVHGPGRVPPLAMRRVQSSMARQSLLPAQSTSRLACCPVFCRAGAARRVWRRHPQLHFHRHAGGGGQHHSRPAADRPLLRPGGRNRRPPGRCAGESPDGFHCRLPSQLAACFHVMLHCPNHALHPRLASLLATLGFVFRHNTAVPAVLGLPLTWLAGRCQSCLQQQSCSLAESDWQPAHVPCPMPCRRLRT